MVRWHRRACLPLMFARIQEGSQFADADVNDVIDNGTVTLGAAEIVFATPEMLCGNSQPSVALQLRRATSACRLIVIDEVRCVLLVLVCARVR